MIADWRRGLQQLRRLPLFLLLFIPAVLIGLQQPPPMARGVRVVDITAAVPQAGGFQPDSVTVYAGQRVQLRFRAADTTHGVAIGPGLGIDLGDLAPGEVKVVDVTFPEAGTYTFYCNKWCSPNHWRMRGVIAVEDPHGSVPGVQHDPVIDSLAAEGIDIDAYLMDGGGTAQASRAHGSMAAVEALAAPLEPAATLYAKNCAACHGEKGDGKGFDAASAPVVPPSFADAERMATRRSDVLYAKIRRGGMGTGMPNFGTLFTPEETWGLVDYLRQLAHGG